MDAEKTCKTCDHKAVCSIWGSAKRFFAKQVNDSLLHDVFTSDNHLEEAIAKNQIATACLCCHYKLDESGDK